MSILVVPDKPTALDDGPYRYEVKKVGRICDNSFLVWFVILGKTVVSKLSVDGYKTNCFLVSCGQKKSTEDPWLATDLEFQNTVGKEGICLVDHYTDPKTGCKRNRVVGYVFPNANPFECWWSYTVKKRANFKCECCGAYGNEAHHIASKEVYPDKKMDLSNGQCLCTKCHRKWHEEHPLEEIGGPGL